MEVYLPSGRRMPRRAARGNDRVQNPAGALGQGTDSNWKENSAARAAQRRTAAHQNRSLVSPDREPQLSAHDRALGSDVARDDHPLLSGMVSDALHRSAAVHGFDVFDFEFLPCLAAGAFSQKL